jgi:guanylate kinase
MPLSPAPLLLIISGPAGSGKTTLCERLLQDFPRRIQRVVTTTSRPPRPGERDGVDYHFLSPETFEERIREGAFIEWACVHGRYYGSRGEDIRRQVQSGHDLLLNIDIQGARSFRDNPALKDWLPRGVQSVFIKPRSMDQLRERLARRGEDPDEIDRRLQSAAIEIREAGTFDHLIVSGSREADYAALRDLYSSIKK